MPHKDKNAAKAYHRAHYLAHRELRLKQGAEYRKNNPEIMAAAQRRWYEKMKCDPAFLARRRAYQIERKRNNPALVKAIEKASYIRNREKRLAYQKALAGTIERKARETVNGAV